MKLILKLSAVVFALSLFAIKFQSSVYAQVTGACGIDTKNRTIYNRCAAGYTCSCDQNSYELWRDQGGDAPLCDCKLPGNQDPCYHTICAVGYKCVHSTVDPIYDYCAAGSTSGGSCSNPSAYGINCPAGTTKGTTLVSRVCARPTYCSPMGSAQSDSGVCCNTLTEPAVCSDWYCGYNPGPGGKICATASNPSKCCRDCTNEVTSCLYNYVDTYNCVAPATAVPVITASPIPTVSPSPVPTAVPTGQCSMTKIYTNGWVELTPQAFTGLTQGIQVYFCVNGITNTSVFDSGRFTINGVVRPVTTLTRPGTNDFCDLYTIPANTYTFKVQGEMHHTLLGWL